MQLNAVVAETSSLTERYHLTSCASAQVAQRRIRVLERLVVQKDMQLREARRVAALLMPEGAGAGSSGGGHADAPASGAGEALAR